MSNNEMREGRILKMYNGRKLMQSILSTLDNGGTVVIATYMKATQYTAKHRSMFKVSASGSVYVQQGKSWNCIDFTPVKFYA